MTFDHKQSPFPWQNPRPPQKTWVPYELWPRRSSTDSFRELFFLGARSVPPRCPGVVAKWNAEHPYDAVRVGDRIVKIDNESLQGFALIEKLKEDAGRKGLQLDEMQNCMKNWESRPRSQALPL